MSKVTATIPIIKLSALATFAFATIFVTGARGAAVLYE